jgi:hypothetical protein
MIINLKEQLQKLSTWTGVVGWITIISGIISTIGGLFLFIIGAIPGIITIVLGAKLISARKHANTLVINEALDDSEMLALISNLTTYFKIHGLLIIIGIILSIVVIYLGFIGALFQTNYYFYNVNEKAEI